MSAIAETPFDAAAGDRLAKRNALVLATGQALAGANNTVIVATGSILGVMMAPDKSLATLPISIMVRRHLGRHPAARLSREALRPPHRVRERRGLRRARRPDRLCWRSCRRSSGSICVATFFGGLYAASHMSYRFGAADTASPEFKPKAIVLGDGGRAVRRDPRAAARDLHQGPDAALSVRRELSRAGGVRGHRRAASS